MGLLVSGPQHRATDAKKRVWGAPPVDRRPESQQQLNFSGIAKDRQPLRQSRPKRWALEGRTPPRLDHKPGETAFASARHFFQTPLNTPKEC